MGGAVAAAAERIGKPLMPWQRHVVDVALELDEAGRFVYDEVGLLVPRQSGKSTLILSTSTHRASAGQFFDGRQRIVYTAQTRNKAREKFEEDFAPELQASRYFGSRVKTHWGNGNEHIRFVNGSRFSIEANTDKAGHGGTLDLSFIDEAFAQADARLEQAFRPAMITRENTQLWWVSTAGWLDGSPYLLEKCRAGRDQADMGVREGLAYFEWSAPDDADPEDEDVWAACMPALGHTISLDAIRAEYRAAVRDSNLNGFRRAYLNQWVLKEDPDADVVFTGDDWAALEGVEESRPDPVVFVVEVADSRKWAHIGLAGKRTDGATHVQVVRSDRGTGWIADKLVELRDAHKPLAVIVNPASPAASLIPDLEAAGIELTLIGGREEAAACGAFVDGVSQGSVRHGGQKLLAISVGVARRRMRGNTWVWKSAEESTDISPLRAVTLAAYGLDRALAAPKKKRSGLVVGLR